MLQQAYCTHWYKCSDIKYADYTEQQGFVNCTAIGGLNQFWFAESRSEIHFSRSHRVFD